MPELVRGHTNAAAIMIGERAADLIRAAAPPASVPALVRDRRAATHGRTLTDNRVAEPGFARAPLFVDGRPVPYPPERVAEALAGRRGGDLAERDGVEELAVGHPVVGIDGVVLHQRGGWAGQQVGCGDRVLELAVIEPAAARDAQLAQQRDVRRRAAEADAPDAPPLTQHDS
jgi:hypothetical protein